MRSPRSPASRRGIGVLLVLILSFIVVLTIYGFATRYLNSAVNSQTQRTSVGELALELAESQVEEMLAVFRVQSNAPGTPIYKLLRHDVYRDDPGALDLGGMLDTPEFRKLLGSDPIHAGFKSREARGDVVYQRQLENLAYERTGLLRLRARVEYSFTPLDTISREVEVGVGFKVLLVAPPRPYDQTQFTLFADNTQASLGFADLNAKTRELTAVVKDTLQSAAQRAGDPSTPDAVRPEYREVASQVQPAEFWQRELKDLPTEKVVLFSTKWTSMSFDDLFIVKKIEDREKAELEPARREVDAAERAVTGVPESVDAQRRLATAYRRQAVALTSILKIMQDQRQLFEIADGTLLDDLIGFRYKLRPDAFGLKPSFVVPDGGCTAAVQRIFGAIRPISGVLRVDNSQPLELVGMDIPGKLVIVAAGTPTAKGGVHLANLNRGERPNDLLTVISLGGPIQIEGDVHAFVIGSQGATLTAAPGSEIHGGLVLDQVPGPNERQFKITRDNKYFTGTTTKTSAQNAFADYYYVATNPRRTYSKVVRK